MSENFHVSLKMNESEPATSACQVDSGPCMYPSGRCDYCS